MENLKLISNLINLIVFVVLLVSAVRNNKKGKELSNYNLMWIIICCIFAVTNNS